MANTQPAYHICMICISTNSLQEEHSISEEYLAIFVKVDQNKKSLQYQNEWSFCLVFMCSWSSQVQGSNICIYNIYARIKIERDRENMEKVNIYEVTRLGVKFHSSSTPQSDRFWWGVLVLVLLLVTGVKESQLLV